MENEKRQTGAGETRHEGKGAPGGSRRPAGHDGKRNDRRPAGSGEKRDFKRPDGHGPRRDDRKPAGNGEKRDFKRPDGHGPRRDDRRPAGPGEKRDFRRPEGSAPRRDDRRPAAPGQKRDFRRPEGDVPRREERRGYQAFEYKKQPREIQGMPSRRSALNVIRAVTEEGAWASTALDRELKKAGLNPKDRRLAARLAYDTLERLNYLDYMLDHVMAKPDTDIRLRNILRLGACQLLLEDHIPEMAATDTSVQLCVEIGMEGLRGVCNGILRNLIRKKDEIQLPDPETEPVRFLSIERSAPEFLVKALMDDYGFDGAREILSASGRDSAITVRPNLLRMTRSEFEKMLEKKVWETEKGEMPDSWYVMNAANIAEDSDFLSGLFSIQSEQSQAACLAASPRRGSMVLDACAAPGGKACYMAELMDGTGRVQAWELRPHRVDLIAAQVKRLQIDNIRPMQRDATVFREDQVEAFDVVLLDAPCTGTGEMHNKPDSKYRIKEDSIAELTRTQHDMLETVSRYVRPGGILVYSTCSVLRDENEKQIRSFLERHPEFTVQPLPDCIPERIRSDYDVGVQLLPGINASGGFYICRMRKRSFA